MTSIQMKAKIVRVFVEHDESGLFFATSSDLKGLLVAKQSLAELRQSIPLEIQKLFLACDVEVVVTEVGDDDGEDMGKWVAIPRAAAEKQLAALAH